MNIPSKPEPAEFQHIQTTTAWKRTLETFAQWCQPQPGERVLDVGCGPGLLPMLFHHMGCQATGIDLDASMFLPELLWGRVVCGDALSLPFTTGGFNLVTSSNLLFYLPSPQEALLEMRRMLVPGGRIGLLNPSSRLSVAAAEDVAERRGLAGTARTSLIDWAQRAENHQRWQPDELAQLCQAAMLTLHRWEYRVGPGFALFASAQRNDP